MNHWIISIIFFIFLSGCADFMVERDQSAFERMDWIAVLNSSAAEQRLQLQMDTIGGNALKSFIKMKGMPDYIRVLGLLSDKPTLIHKTQLAYSSDQSIYEFDELKFSVYPVKIALADTPFKNPIKPLANNINQSNNLTNIAIPQDLNVSNNNEFALHRVALVIGNSEYQHGMQLKNPVNDAEDISLLLKKLGSI